MGRPTPGIAVKYALATVKRGVVPVQTRFAPMIKSLRKLIISMSILIAPGFLNLHAGGISSVAQTTAAAPEIVRNIKADFGAKGNGEANDSLAFAAFNAWARRWQRSNGGLIELHVPPGTYNVTGWPFLGIKKIVVIGYGATLQAPKYGSLFLGGRGQYQDNAHSARVASVQDGATSVTLVAPNRSSLFTAGNYALITGYDLQGLWHAPYGFPSNAHFFEYVKIRSVNPTTGVIEFDEPLKNTYLSTWPNYNAGNRVEIDSGGPGTLYALHPSWDIEVEYKGLTIRAPYQIYAAGRSVTYTDAKFPDGCPIPSLNQSWTANESNIPCYIEADKLVETITFNGVNLGAIDFQSSSINLMRMNGTSVLRFFNGTPKKAIISNSTIRKFGPGALYYGRTDEVVCTGCDISQFSRFGANVTIDVYRMENGTITIPNTKGAVSWAVPGTHAFFSGAQGPQVAFTVLDVTQDADNTYVRTNLTGGFPPGVRNIQVHPAPKFTCAGCRGIAGAALSLLPADAPLFSYARYTVNGSKGTAYHWQPTVWGALSALSINVTNAYGGAGELLFHLAAFDNWPVFLDNLPKFYGAIVDVKTPGNRVVTPSDVTCNGVSGACSTKDSGLAVAGAIWFAGQTNSASQFYPDPSSRCPGVGCPSITVTIVTDQGF